jgi:hypothetical protein
MTNRSFLSRGKEARTDKEMAAWTDTPADRQRKAAEARAAAEHRSMQLRLTGRADVPPSASASSASSSADKRGGSGSASAASSAAASASASSSSSASAAKQQQQQSLVEIHAARVAEEKRTARALTDPRFAHFNSALLAPEFDREKDFQVH